MTSRKSRRSQKARRASQESKLRFADFGVKIIMARMKKGKGPKAWCNTCSRLHRRGETCNLYLRTRTAKSGKKVKVWAR